MDQLSLEEVLLKQYKLLGQTVKAHKELILPNESLDIKIQNCPANESLIGRLTNSFELQKRQSAILADGFGLDITSYKRFLTSYAKTLVQSINASLETFHRDNLS